MDRFIIQRKIIDLVKNKESDFRIPTAFNPLTCELIVEVDPGQFQEDILVELQVKRTQSGDDKNTFAIPVALNKTITRFSFKDADMIHTKDHLLIGCRSNHSFQLALSLRLL